MSTQTQQQLVTVTIDGVKVSVPKGTLLVEAAKQIKQEIPVYCYHTKLGPAGLCRVCLVEIEGMPKLQIACNTPVSDGMVVHTESERAKSGRSMVVELLLVNHPLDCPICDKGGECDLQDYAMAYGRGFSDVIDAKASKPKAADLGPTIVLDEERCIVCQRCVRFDEIVADENQLVVKDRGQRDIIATATGAPYRHNWTGNVTEICPVGALTSKTYRFKSRPWDLQRTETTCTHCAVGCRMYSDVRFGAPQRTMLVEEDSISDGWLCDRGRYNIGFYGSRERVLQPLYKRDGRFVQIGWDDAFGLWARAIKDAIAAGGSERVGAIGGGRLTNEEAYLLQYAHRALGVANLDWRSGAQRQATPGKNGGAIADVERAQIVLIVGESPTELAPVLELRVRKAAKRNGARVATVASAREALEAAGTERRCVALVWDGVDGALAKSVYDALAGTHDLSTYVASRQANARGAEAMGMLPNRGPGYVATPETGADGDEMFARARAGRLDVLSIFGANPALNHPDGPGVRAAFAKLPFLVVSELFLTETAQAAALVLPAKGAFEKSGTTINLAGDLLPVEQSLRAPDGVLSDFEMLIGLAQQLDLSLPTVEDLDAAVIVAAAKPADAFVLGDPSFGAAPAVRNEGGEGVTVRVETRLFAGGGTSANDPRVADLRPVPTAAFAPEDARRYGIAFGDYVDLQAGSATEHDLIADVREDVAPGTVLLIGGLPGDPANELGIGTIAQVKNVRKSAPAVEA